jgi:hypothetical protein
MPWTNANGACRFLAAKPEQPRRNQALLLRHASNDALTGIADRRWFLEKAGQEPARSRDATSAWPL